MICFIGKIDNILDRKKIRLIGYGYSQSKGIKNGGITNINDLEESIRKAVDLAENQANYEVENVSVNVSGNYIRTERVFGEFSIGNQIINPNHIKEVIEIAIIENVQRSELKPLEEADGYFRLVQEFDYSHEKISNLV